MIHFALLLPHSTYVGVVFLFERLVDTRADLLQQGIIKAQRLGWLDSQEPLC